MEHLLGADAAAGGLVGVGRADTSPRRTQRRATTQPFGGAVQGDVIGQDQVGLAAQLEPGRRNIYAARRQAVHLSQ